MLDKDFSDVFTLSVQDLAARKVDQELNLKCVPCGMHQGNKAGIGAEGGITRNKDNVIVSTFPEVLDTMSEL